MNNYPIRPQHKVCEVNVVVPTIVVEDEKVWVQWFGESHFVDLTGMQFLFPVPLSTENIHWMNHPEMFRVILLG